MKTFGTSVRLRELEKTFGFELDPVADLLAGR
jgi:hypothetical protein